MGDTIGPIIARRLDGGRVTLYPEHGTGVEESPNAENLDPSSYRGAETRAGRAQFLANNGSGTSVNGIFHWTRNAGTAFLFFANGTNVYAESGASWASLMTGVADGGAVRMAALDDKLVIVGESFAPRKTTDGTTTSALAGSPPSSAQYIALYKSKVFLAGDTNNPQKITFCASNNPEDWIAANNAGSVTIDAGGGDTIQGLMATQDTLVVLFRHQAQAVFGDSVFNYFVRPIFRKGLVSKTGYAAGEKIGFFASDDGVYAVSGGTVSLISLKAKKDYDDISDKTKVTLAVKNDKLYVIDYGAASPYALVCDYKIGRWAKWTAQPFKVAALGIDNALYGGTSGSTVQAWKLDQGTLDGTATIAAKWTTPDLDFDRWDLVKTINRYLLHAKPGLPTTTVKFFYDGASIANAHTHVFTTTGRHEYAQKAVPRAGSGGHYVSMEISWTGVGTLYGWTLYGVLRDSPDQPSRNE